MIVPFRRELPREARQPSFLFRAEVLRGLRAPEKHLPCKYFYDEAGSELFERITELDYHCRQDHPGWSWQRPIQVLSHLYAKRHTEPVRGKLYPVGYICPGFRVYFVRHGAAVYVLLCGGDKSSQRRDIARAKRMARELKESGR